MNVKRAPPLSCVLDKSMNADPGLLQQEALTLIREIEMNKGESKWQFKKGFKLIELGRQLNEPLFIERGQRFLNNLGFLI